MTQSNDHSSGNTAPLQSPPPLCLTIAGSDPGGGAGIQGDLKTFAAHSVYGMAVITALTAQNTMAVTGVVGIQPEFVRQQIQTIYDDLPALHVKTGMLLNAGIINTVADFYTGRPDICLTVDPVMISSSGGKLLEDDAIAAYVDRLFPLARVITPNNLETRHFTGISIECVDDAVRASEKLLEMGAPAAIVKGGDTRFREASDKLFDVLNEAGQIHVFERPLVGARNSHGTGCAFASAICSQLALGRKLASATDLAGQYIGGALRHAFPTGKGSGSINHSWNNCSNEVP
jgi:hydroxymethylpyrimidine/phosphomethylpyrimidine kinase